MTRRNLGLGLLLAVSWLAPPAIAQVGHPAKGSWSGYWGPDRADQRRILLLLDWRDNKIIGTINPGPNAVQIDKADLDVSTWTLKIEANMPTEDGHKARFVAIGKLENLGSWTNRTYTGSYRLGDERGTFKMALN